jgi:cytidylate kinase
MDNQRFVLTIDGPSGSGKGTVAKALAKHLGFHLLDSGAIYRVTALAVEKKKLESHQIEAIAELAENLDLTFSVQDSGLVKVLLEGEDVNARLRTEECGLMASKIASIPDVRAALLQRQKAFLELPGLVADGRDMGTVVFPQARAKIFLNASAEVRAQRRFDQLKGNGVHAIMASLVNEIQERDENDRNRSVSPLVPAVDALEIDSSNMSISEVVSQVIEFWESKA